MHDRPLARLAAGNVEGIQAEIAQEKAAALGGMAGRLEDALRRLEEHAAANHPHDEPDVRDRLIATAAEALWYYVVQREACGLRDTEQVLRHYRVPRNVYLRMGARPAGPGDRAI
ncbi:MAG TPA: DUF6665 family protein [Longimicrobium sp.]|nr:DUF6665 family protein [Longimicrobium sp.]